MSYKQSFQDVLKDAKKAFEDIERTAYEKQKSKPQPSKYKKMIGFTYGMKEIEVYR